MPLPPPPDLFSHLAAGASFPLSSCTTCAAFSSCEHTFVRRSIMSQKKKKHQQKFHKHQSTFHHSHRARGAFRQRLPQASSGPGTQVLYRCPVCSRPWLQDGHQIFLRLEKDQVSLLVTSLGADLE